MTSSTYLRYPHVHEGLITFVAEDDVWLAEVPAAGSSARAWRVTSDRLPVLHPRISPDGTRIGWRSPKDGAPEIYTAPVDGGADVRLTYWGDFATDLAGWLSAGEVVVVTSQVPGWSNTCAFAIAAEGGVPRPLPYGTVRAVDTRGPGGAVLLQRGLRRDNSSWKRYRGGTAGRLWLDPDGSGEFHRFLPDHVGDINTPLWVGGRAAFLSDADGVSELYSALPDGTDLRRHTSDAAGYYARHAATDGTRVAFMRAGRLWLLEDLADPAAEPRPLDIRLTGTRVGRARHPVGAARNLGGWDTDRTGRASVVTVRGTVHWLTHHEGPARVLAAEDGVRCRRPVVLGDTGDVAWVSDAGGEDGLEIASASGAGEHRRILSGELGRVDDIVASPDGAHLAVSTEDNRLLLVDVAAGTARTVVETDHGSYASLATGMAFSPDSAWLAWAEATAVVEAQRIRLADVATLTASDVTEGRFADWSPAFTADGKHLAFLSTRTFDPRYEEYVFDLTFVPGTRPYLVPLSAEEPSPFAPHLKGWPVGDEDKEEEKAAARKWSLAAVEVEVATTVVDAVGTDSPETAATEENTETEDTAEQPAKKESAKKAPATKVDREGLKGRIVPFPVRAGEFSSLSAVKGGVVWIETPIHGRLGESLADASDEPDRARLRRYDFAKREASTLVDELDGYAVSGDGARIVVRDGAQLRCQPSDSRGGGDGDKGPVDLDRIRVTVDPVAERRQAYHEAWRLQRDFYWRSDMNGLDWDAVRTKYEPLIEAVATASDFEDLLGEMQGELGTSHAYVNGPGVPGDAAKRQGLLGADLEPDAEGLWRIVRILPGDSSLASARSPLEAPGVAARPGDAVAAVDGVPVPALGPGPLLAGKAGRPVELTLHRDGAEPRRVVVVPTDDENQLRYVAWVAGRRAHVAERSGGRLGYIHLPDQGPRGWAEFHRDLSSQTAKEGLIVDSRGNGGGNTSELVLQKLLRTVDGWSMARGRVPQSYPRQAPLGPIVGVCDEHASSDGDIINQALKDHGVPIVGVRTWGGTVGIDSRFRLVDGTAVTQPKYAHYFLSTGYGVENHGVDPTVEVHRSPQDIATGRDPQLDEAIRIALEKLEESPAAAPPARSWL